jgi:uncharacterized membrane protein
MAGSKAADVGVLTGSLIAAAVIVVVVLVIYFIVQHRKNKSDSYDSKREKEIDSQRLLAAIHTEDMIYNSERYSNAMVANTAPTRPEAAANPRHNRESGTYPHNY